VPAPAETEAPVVLVPPSCAPINRGGKGNGGKGKGGDLGKGIGKGSGAGKGGTDGKGISSGKGGDSGKGQNGGKGSGKGDDVGKGGNVGKGSGKGDDNSNSKGKGAETIRKKGVYDGKMDKLSTEDEERRLGTGGVECPEIPDDDYYNGKGKGGDKGMMDGGNGKGGKGNENSKGKGKGSETVMGKGGKGGSIGKGDKTEDGGKGKGSVILMKKSKDHTTSSMEITRVSSGKGKHKSKEDVGDDYSGQRKTR
jgi:hypothetical protein